MLKEQSDAMTAAKVAGWQAAINEQLGISKESAQELTGLLNLVDGLDHAKAAADILNLAIANLIDQCKKSTIESDSN